MSSKIKNGGTSSSANSSLRRSSGKPLDSSSSSANHPTKPQASGSSASEKPKQMQKLDESQKKSPKANKPSVSTKQPTQSSRESLNKSGQDNHNPNKKFKGFDETANTSSNRISSASMDYESISSMSFNEPGQNPETGNKQPTSLSNYKPSQQLNNKTLQPKRIPAIKFTIRKLLAKDFYDQNKLKQEILRCRPSLNLKLVKFFNIKFNSVMIATDDQETHDYLTEEWPADSFGAGIRFVRNNSAAKEAPRSITRHELPAIKLKLKPIVVASFDNNMKIFKEIKRCFPKLVNPVLKFAQITETTLMLATDDQETHNILNGVWPDDAFELGVEKPEPKPITAPHLCTITLKGVRKEYDLYDQDIVDQLATQGILKADRIKNKDNVDTVYVSATCSNHNIAINLTKNGVYIGPEHIKAEFRIKPHQCHKCQQFGHSSATCEQQQRCVRCSGPHQLSECSKENEVKCANCNKNHSSCSRSCVEVKQAVQQRIANITYARVLTFGSAPKPDQNKPKPTPPTTVQNSIVDELKAQITFLQDKLISLETLLRSLIGGVAPQLSLPSSLLTPFPVQVSNHPIQQQ